MLSFKEIESVVSKNPALEDLKDSRDFLFKDVIGAVTIPKNFSLRAAQTSVKSQGARGTCVGMASTAMTEFHNAKEYVNPNLDLSEEYMFKRIKDIDKKDYNYEGYGAYARSGAKALVKYGSCLESTAPYNTSNKEDIWKSFTVSPEMDEEAASYRMKSYLSVSRREEEIKKALTATNTPLLATVKLHESYRQAKKDGAVPVPKEGEKVIGGHAMLITGYSSDYIEFKNSWGEGWGDEGYLYWPWANVENLGVSIWAFTDLILNPYIEEEALIELNKKYLLYHQVNSWDKAIKQGIVTGGTVPKDVLTKGDLMVFFDRMGFFK